MDLSPHRNSPTWSPSRRNYYSPSLEPSPSRRSPIAGDCFLSPSVLAPILPVAGYVTEYMSAFTNPYEHGATSSVILSAPASPWKRVASDIEVTGLKLEDHHALVEDSYLALNDNLSKMHNMVQHDGKVSSPHTVKTLHDIENVQTRLQSIFN